jgi:hypothetical protein
MITTDGRSSVEVAIEHLVLDGFEPQQGQEIASTIKEKLALLIEEKGLPGEIPENLQAGQVDAGSVQVSEAAGTARIGAQIAEAIYNRLSRMIWRGKADD